MSRRKCAFGCEGYRTLFTIPKEHPNRQKWLEFLSEIPLTSYSMFVCDRHFPDGCFPNLGQYQSGLSERLTLAAGAIPTLKTPYGMPIEDTSQEPPGHTALTGYHATPLITPSRSIGVQTTVMSPVLTRTVSTQFPPCTLKLHHDAEDQLTTHPCSEESSPNLLGSDNGSIRSGTPTGLCESKQAQPGQILNTELIVKETELLKKKGMFPVSEKHLLRLFSRNCPSCGGKLEMHRVVCGVVVNFNQLCVQCDYMFKWKSQAAGSVPAAEDGQVAVVEETPSCVTDVPEIVAEIDDDNESKTDSNESCDPGCEDSDSDYQPGQNVFPVKLFPAKQNDKSGEHVDYCDYLSLTPVHNQLCTDCGRFFDRRKSHVCEHKIRPYSCNICGKRCVSEVALNVHSRIHGDNYEFRCKYCHATFKLKVDKFTHEQIHIAQGKPYKCPDCSETFATNKERRIHLEDHRGTVELKCRFCGVEFYRPLSIQRHLLTHTGVKPYKCSVCKRGFSQGSHLKSHMRLHTGERPYKCQHCDKCFNHNVSLKSHVQRCHGPSSKEERRKNKTKQKQDSDTNDAQIECCQRGADQDVDTEEEEDDTIGNMEVRLGPKSKRKTGRPIGRPKNFGSGKSLEENQAGRRGSSSRHRRSKRKRQKPLTDEDDEDVQYDSNASLESEEEKCRKSTRNRDAKQAKTCVE